MTSGEGARDEGDALHAGPRGRRGGMMGYMSDREFQDVRARYAEGEQGDVMAMSDENVPRYTVAIDEPTAEMVRCAVAACRREVPKHEAYRVTVERWWPIGREVHWTVGGESLWSHSMRSWSAEASRRLTAASTAVFVGMPASTHEIHTYTGYACCKEHADAAALECPA